jgi:hypothetical protein
VISWSYAVRRREAAGDAKRSAGHLVIRLKIIDVSIGTNSRLLMKSKGVVEGNISYFEK